MAPSRVVLRAWSAMRRSPWLQLSAIGAMTAAMLIAGLAALVALNTSRLTAHWGAGLHLVVYLKHEVSDARVQRLRANLARRPEVAAIQLISAKMARARLARGLGAQSGLLEGLEQDILPPSFELQLRGRSDHHRALLALLESLPEVDEIDHLGHWAERLGLVAALIRAGLVVITLLVGLACIYVVTSTIKLGTYARAEEIKIQRLLGADGRFINAPLLIEGLIQGLSSVALALALLYGLFALAAPRVAEGLGPLCSELQLHFLSPTQAGLALLAGAAIGFAGSRLALLGPPA